MKKNNHYDLIVIGAGSAGLAAAKKAAENGATVALVEMKTIGGTCVNVGCVPKKITWYAAAFADFFSYAKEYGFQNQAGKFLYKKFATARSNYIKTLDKRYQQRVQADKITWLEGQAKFTDPHSVKINNDLYTAKHIIIATGCSPNIPDIEGAEFALDSDGFFELNKLPKKMAVIGGGYIGMELTFILHQLGVEVHLVLRGTAPLSGFDDMIVKAMQESIKTKKINLYKNHDVEKITRQQKKLTLHCNKNKKIKNLDGVLFAIGRHPCTKNLNLPAAGVKLNKEKYIHADKYEVTNVPHIYAIGDVAGKKLQTPVAVAAGRILASRIFGGKKKAFLDYNNIPTVIFTHPPAGSVGLTEKQAVEKYRQENLVIYESHFASLFYALSKKKPQSHIKLITLKKSGKVVGCHVIDKHADEMMPGIAIAIKMGATKTDFDNTIGIHPTSAEELLTMTHKREARN